MFRNTKTGSTRVWKTVLTVASCGTVFVVATTGISADILLHPYSRQGQDTPARSTTQPPVPPKGKFGQDLFLAIDHRDLSGVQALIAKGADPNAKNGLEFRPLFLAAASYQNDVVQALLAAGANPDVESSYGTPLTFAAATGNLGAANLLFAKGVNVNTSRVDGITPLIMAANSGSPEFVAELIKRKADVNMADNNGTSPLGWAARGGHVEVGRALLDAGATVDTADAEHQTPLMAAAATGHADFVKLLLQKGAKPNTRDKQGKTALILAAEYGDYPEVVRALLAGGADKSATDSTGCTAAALATVRGYTASAAILGKPSASALTAAGPVRSPKQAVTASLKMLTVAMKVFTEQATCISCHQEGLGRIVTGSARDHGFPIDQAVDAEQNGRINGALTALAPLHSQALKSPEAMKQVPLIEINEVSTIDGWIMAGMVAHKTPPTEASAAMAMVLARQQAPDGHWGFSLPRVPMQSSFFTFTALAARNVMTYGPKSSAAEIADRVRKAKSWLMTAPAKTSEDRAMRLLGLKWTGATTKERAKALSAIQADQRPDGGWSQLPGMQSDAYATGQALYALRVGGGVSATSSAYKRGVKYLVRTQDKDGTWFVNKRALPANNYFDSGFPHGESQFASFNGSCWATLALMESLSKG